MYEINIKASAKLDRTWADGVINEIREDYFFSKEQAKEIAEAVRAEQGNRIDRQQNRFDGGLRSLKIATILRKGHSRALIDTGGLKNSWRLRAVKDGFRISPSGKYRDIAAMLNDGTSRMEAFNAFGVEEGTQIMRDIDRLIDGFLNKKKNAA